MITELLIGIVVVLISGISILLKEYFKKKGEFLAAKEEIGTITREKKKVENEFDEKLEELKKEHQLEIERRRHQYVVKQNEFSKFFSLLDEYNRNCNQKAWVNFQPVINTFFSNYIEAEESEDKEAANRAITTFSESISLLTMKLNEESIRIRNETYSIKLIAPQEIIKLIDDLDKLLEETFNATIEVVRKMTSIELFGKPEAMLPFQEKAIKLGNEVKSKHYEIMELMRKHLDCI